MESRKVIVIGASGHGKVIADIIKASDDVFVGFLDDDSSKNVLGVVSDYKKYSDCWFVIGIGDTTIRERLSRLSLKWYTAIHPSAIISPSAFVGEGTVIMPNAVINANSSVGKHCIINTASVIEHDNKIGDYSHVSVGAKLGGTVEIGTRCWIGLGAVINNNVSIIDGTTIGSGCVVIHSIKEKGIYIGIPARKKDD